MKNFYFKVNDETDKHIYHAILNNGRYEIGWDEKENRISYKKSEIKKNISNNTWIVINEEVETEDF